MVASDLQAINNCNFWYLNEIPGEVQNSVAFDFTDGNGNRKEVNFGIERAALDNWAILLI